MPVVVVASFTAKPESADTVRAACERAIAEVHHEPGCELYSLHQSGDTFVFIEQWADAHALKTHSTARPSAPYSGRSASIWPARRTSRCSSRYRPAIRPRAGCAADGGIGGGKDRQHVILPVDADSSNSDGRPVLYRRALLLTCGAAG